MRRRMLTAEERALWAHATRAVKRLATATDSTPPPPPTVPEPAPSPPPAAAPAAPVAKIRQSAGNAAPPVPGLDRRTAQRLKRGRFPIDASFDLHGHTQASAHDALLAFLQRSRGRGFRHVLVVTGRGAAGGGVLKRSVPRWLQEPGFQRHVLGFTEAGPRHGGEGALYVVLRRGHASS
ncbi:MAG: DNA mismatch repair protein MutS [Geminicoccaceae bacterium]|nr:MAG: DNA mismatch repair protein MutS [Geminicoccaceae bacterium]